VGGATSRCALAALGLAAVLLAACEGRRAPPERVLRPGDSLLGHLERLAVTRRSRTNLPPALADAARIDDARVVLGPDAFTAPATAPPELAAWWRERDLPGTPRVFTAPLPGPVDVPVGRLQVSVDGRRLARLDAVPGAGPDLPGLPFAFLDPASGPVVHCAGRTLTLVGARPPARLVLRLAGRVREALAPREPAAGAAVGGRRRVSLGSVDRPVLTAPAPTELTWPGLRLVGEALELAIAVEDVALARDGETLAIGRGASDGVTFAVEATLAGTRRRLWSRRLPPAERFVQARVALPDEARGVPLALHLVTEPGADAAFDYAVWGELRVAGPPARPPARPHVVLIVIDTLRADRVGPRPDGSTLTPALDAWAAAHATVFEDAVATASWTYPSAASLLSGLAPHQHGVTTRKDRWDAIAATRGLAARLRAAGYETRAATDGGFVGPLFGFAHGFDRFDATRDPDRWHTEPDWEDPLTFLETRRGERPVFVLLHSYIVHDPYQPDADAEARAGGELGALAGVPIGHVNVIGPVQEGRLELDATARHHVERLYDAGVRRMDRALGRALARLEAALDGEPRLVIVTSDHGEELFEHGALGHGHSLYDELLRVPLLVAFPGGRGPARDDRPASLLDVVPTVLEAAHLPVPGDLPGHPLQRPPAGRPVPRVAAHEGGVQAIRWRGIKAILGGPPDDGRLAPALFDLARDPAERADVSRRRPDRMEALRAALEDYRRAWPSHATGAAPRELDPATAADLRALGYLGDG